MDCDRASAVAGQNDVVRAFAIGIRHILDAGFISGLQCVTDIIILQTGNLIHGRLNGSVRIDLCPAAKSGNRGVELRNVDGIRGVLTCSNIADLDRIACSIVQREATSLIALGVGIIEHAILLDVGNVFVVTIEAGVLLSILLLDRIKSAILLGVLVFDCVQASVLFGILRVIGGVVVVVVHNRVDVVLVFVLDLLEGVVDFSRRDEIVHAQFVTPVGVFARCILRLAVIPACISHGDVTGLHNATARSRNSGSGRRDHCIER